MKISVFLLFYGSIEIEGCVKPVEIINFRKSLMCSRSTQELNIFSRVVLAVSELVYFLLAS